MINKRVLTCVLVGAAALLLVASVGTVAAQGPELTAIEKLGKSIFFDGNLSINRNQSCASCHAPEWGWTGPDSDINAHGAVYEGSIPGRFGDRKPPSAAYATQSPIFYMDKKGLFVGGNFWDGRATGEVLGNPAADQALGPFLNPAEQALPDSACVVYRVCTASYPVSFEAVWGAGACRIAWPANVDSVCRKEGKTVRLSDADRAKSDMAYGNIGLSIAAYEASPEVNAFTSEYDYTFTGAANLNQEEQQGFALFQGKGKCKLCHISSGKQPLFTDFTFDNLGVPKNPENPFYGLPAAFNPDGMDFVDYGLGPVVSNAEENGENGKFKVMTLRNIGLTEPYAHNGFFKNLKDITHFYNTRDVEDWPEPEYPDTVNFDELGSLGLSDKDEDALVKFMKTLSDGYVP